MDAVAYARYSSDNQREESITAQIRAIEESAARYGHTITKTYVDEAKSAKTDNRPEFLHLMADVKAHKVKVLFVHKLDRFCRNRYDSAFYKKVLKDNDVTLISVLENIDDSPESIILESVLEGMAEYYSANLAREVRKGLKENALSCKFTGGRPPYGYAITSDKDYIIDKKEADAVCKIFEMVCNMETSTNICKWLTDNHYYTRTGKNFSKSALTNIIPNEKYKGVYVYNKYTRKKIDGIIKDLENDDDNIIRIQDGVPRIISDDMWERANTIFRVRKRTGRPATEGRIYLLSGIVFCGLCGNHMIGEHTNARGNRVERTIYNCRGKKVKNVCAIKAVRKDLLEEIVLDALDSALSVESINSAVEQLFKNMNDFNTKIPGEIKSLQGKLQTINTKIDKVIDLMIETNASTSLKEKLALLEEEKSDIKEKIAYHQDKQRLFRLPEKEYMKQNLKKDINVKQKSPSEQKRIIGTYVEKILVFPDHVEIYMDRVIEYGDEENRTPVQKPIHKNFFHHSFSFNIPSFHRRKAGYGPQ